MEQQRDEMKKKKRPEGELKALKNRLNRIEGQVRGIRKMLDEDAYCTDVLIQVAAVNAALNSFSRVMLENHLKSCVVQDIRNGNDEVIEELVELLRRITK